MKTYMILMIMTLLFCGAIVISGAQLEAASHKQMDSTFKHERAPK